MGFTDQGAINNVQFNNAMLEKVAAANSTSMRYTMQLTSLGPFDENRDDRRKRTL